MTSDITWMCANGHHGSTQRRSVEHDGWSAMWTGKCAGTARNLSGETHDCPCSCHTPHNCDADCAPFMGPDDADCSMCGVMHGDPCSECEGRGFHKAGCTMADETCAECVRSFGPYYGGHCDHTA